MATRLYFQTGTVDESHFGVPVTPSTWSAGWNKTTGTTTGNIVLRPQTSTTLAFQNKTNAGVGVSGQFTAMRRSVSPPLGVAQTISGTAKGVFRCAESAATDNYTIAVAIKVIQSDGTDRGILLAVSASDDTSATPPEMATTGVTRQLRDSAESASLTLSSVAAQPNDRIVVEIGFRQASTSTGNGTIVFGAMGGVADFDENDTAITNINSWVEFSQDLKFIAVWACTATPEDDILGTGVADPTAVTPPTGMLAGDLVCMTGQERNGAATLVISATGGQIWNTEAAINATSQTARLFWCVFNGTWTANPSVDFTGTTCNTVIMHVFRPPATDWSWKVNQAQVELDDATDPFTITGQTTTGTKPTVTFAGWFAADNNTWGTISGTGWQTVGDLQYRNSSGSDQGATFAHIIQFAAAATGNVSKSQLTLGADASTTFIITFEADDPIPELVMPPMLPPAQFQ